MQTQPDQGSVRWENLIFPGLLVALLPAVGFDLAHAYEDGFAHAYGYPSDLINLQLGTIFEVVGTLILFVLVGLQLANVIYVAWRKPIGVLTLYFGPPLAVTALAVSYVVIYWGHWSRWRSWLLFAAIFAIPYLALPFILHPHVRGFKAKIAAQFPVLLQTHPVSNVVWRKAGLLGIFIVAALLLVGWANGLGEAAALNQRDYLVTTDGGVEQALLRVYGTEAIFAPVDQAHHTLMRQLLVIQLNPAQPLHLTWKTIGPLDLDAMNQHT